MERKQRMKSWMNKWNVPDRLLCTLPWTVVCFSAIFLKWKLLRFGGFPLVMTGQSSTPYTPSTPVEGFGLGQQVSFFRADLLILLFVVPLILTLLPVDRLWRVPVISLICSLAIWFLDIEHHAVNVTGGFVPLDILWDGISWGMRRPSAARPFISLRSISLLLALQAAIVMIARWVRRLRCRGQTGRVLRALALPYVALLSITAVAWSPWIPDLSYHTSVVFIIWKALRSNEELAPVPPEKVVGLYQAFAHSPKNYDHYDLRTHWGQAEGSDVILFILETAPERCVDLAGDPNRLPNIRRLMPRSWVGTRHYTTYPLSEPAAYSILSSRYPPEHPASDAEVREETGGLMKAVRAIGYQTALYSDTAFPSFPYADLGIEHMVRADEEWPSGTPHSDRPEELDAWALQLMKRDLLRWIGENRRFAVLYFPQVAHGPWIDIKDHPGKEKSPLERCQALVSLEDEWLGQLIGLLAGQGRLSHTLIVLTGDHGIRMRSEDPSLRPGRIDSYSFQVPFLLYAPTAVANTEQIPWVTSHIDISPSLLDLLGVKEGRGLEQGSAIWNDNLKERITYFWAKAPLGADGYFENGEYYMWNRLSNAVFTNHDLHFEDTHLVANNSSVYDRVVRSILEMDSIRTNSERAARLGGVGR